MIFSENRFTLFRIMLQGLGPQASKVIQDAIDPSGAVAFVFDRPPTKFPA